MELLDLQNGENSKVYFGKKYLEDNGHPAKGIKRSKETIEKLRESREGFKHSEETKLEMRRTRKGRIVSEEGRKNISKGKIGDKNPMYKKYGELHHSSKIIFNTETSEIVYGITELSKLLNINRSILKDCLNGYRVNHTPYIFLEVIENFEEFFRVNEDIKLNEIFTEAELLFINNSTFTQKRKDKNMEFFKRYLLFFKHDFRNM